MLRLRGLFCRSNPATKSPVLLFRRIFKFEPAKVAQMEQRLNNRHVPGASFPLHAWLVTAKGEWPARIRDMSGNGAALLVDAAAAAAPGDPVQVRFALGAHRQTLPGRIVQARPGGAQFQYGVGLQFPDFPARQSYLQLLQPVAIGQSLRPVPDERVTQDEPGFIKHIFRGEENSVLTVWLAKSPGTPLHSFEFELQDTFCRGEAASGKLEAYSLESDGSHKNRFHTPIRDESGELETEIRHLVRWLIPNLSTVVPDDVRALLQRFVI